MRFRFADTCACGHQRDTHRPYGGCNQPCWAIPDDAHPGAYCTCSDFALAAPATLEDLQALPNVDPPSVGEVDAMLSSIGRGGGCDRKQVTLTDCFTSLLLLEGFDADRASDVGRRFADVAVEMTTRPEDRQRALLEWLDRCADEASVADGEVSDA